MTRTTRLDSIELTNYRSFRSLTIDFHPQLTVLVARNGMGKTAVLDACALAWRYFVDTLRGAHASLGFHADDVRLSRTASGQMIDQLPVRLVATGRVRDQPIQWTRELGKRHGRTTYATAAHLHAQATNLLKDLRDYGDVFTSASPDLPVIAYYGTGRLWSEGRLGKRKRARAQRLDAPVDAYADCLDPRSSFAAFEKWFEAASREAQRLAATTPTERNRPAEYLHSVRHATNRILAPSGWRDLAWDFVGNRVVASHSDAGELPVDLLSDGVRNTLGLVADLAHRCARLNLAGPIAPLRTSGVVLIDEVDMHLHPGWQQEVLPALREAFPAVQFIVTTHSPQVLSTVPAECIRILDEGPDGAVCRRPGGQTQGVPAGDVLAAVLGTDPAPDLPIRRDLDRYRAMVQDGTYDSADGRALRDDLEAHFGPKHPEIFDLDRLIRFRRVLATRDSGGSA